MVVDDDVVVIVVVATPCSPLTRSALASLFAVLENYLLNMPLCRMYNGSESMSLVSVLETIFTKASDWSYLLDKDGQKLNPKR